MPGHIVVVGSINMDLVVRAPRHPLPGETILGIDFHTFPGGKGANQAVAAARLGGAVKMVGRVGADAFGETLLAGLRQDGVDTQAVRLTPDTPTGVALITVSDAGQNNIVVVPGANHALTPADITAAEAVFRGAAVVLMQLEIPLPAVRAAAQLARRHGARVILNPSPAVPLDSDLLALVDCLIPNEYEAAQLTGIADPQAAALALAKAGVGCLTVTLGADGALLVERGQVIHIPPHRVAVVDTTAAGDAFAGAFAAALAAGEPPLTAAAWGSAAGALAVTAAGAQPSLPTRAALLRLLSA